MRSEILRDARWGGKSFCVWVDSWKIDVWWGEKKLSGEEILVDQSSTVEVEEGEEEEKMEGVGEEWRSGECGVGKRDLEREESGVKRPRICTAACGGRVVLLGVGESNGVEW